MKSKSHGTRGNELETGSTSVSYASGMRVSGEGFKVEGSGFRVKGLGFRVLLK